MITQKLGWQAWCSEVDGHGSIISSLSLCLREVENSDYFLLVLGADNGRGRYGSKLDIEKISFTEAEYQHALSCFWQGKGVSEIGIFIQRNVKYEVSVQQLIHAIKDVHVGHFVDFCDKPALVSKVENRLKQWFEAARSTPELYLQTSLRKPEFLYLLKPSGQINLRLLFPGRRFSYVVQRLEALKAKDLKYSKESEYIAQLTKLLVKQTLRMKAPLVRSRDKELLELWGDLLERLLNALNALGRPGLALTLAKARFHIYTVLGHVQNRYHSAHNIANSLYVLGQTDSAMLWDSFAISRLDENASASELDGMGAICMTQGDIISARRYYERAFATSEVRGTRASALSHLGEVETLSSSFREKHRGEKKLRKAVNLSKEYPITNVRAKRNLTKHLIRVGNRREGMRQLREAISIAQANDLHDQLRRHLWPLALELFDEPPVE